jgi:hypothetical protein
MASTLGVWLHVTKHCAGRWSLGRDRGPRLLSGRGPDVHVHRVPVLGKLCAFGRREVWQGLLECSPT